MRVSHTRLDVADGCLARFDKRYRREIPEPPAAPFRIGKAGHKLFDLYGVHCLETDNLSDPGILATLARDVCYDPSDPESPGPAYYSELLKVATDFAKSHDFVRGRVIGLELGLPQGWEPPDTWPVESNLGERHTFVGVLDKVELEDESTILVTDYKLDYWVRSQSAVDSDPQLRRYAWLAGQAYPQMKRFIMRLDFVRHGVTREVVYKREELPNIEAELLATVDALAARTEFPPTPGESCSICGYAATCPALADDSEIPKAIRCHEDARRVMERWVLYKEATDRLRDLLKPWCSHYGPVTVNGMQAGHFKSTTYGIADTKEFADWMSGKGRDPYAFLAVPTEGLRAARKEMGGLPNALLVDKSSTKFALKKAAEETA